MAVPEDMFSPLLYAHNEHLFNFQDNLQKNYKLTEVQEGDCFSPFVDIEGRCLYYSTDMQAWDAAQKACEDINGILIEIAQEEQEPLSEYLLNNTLGSYMYGAFWTGGTDKLEEDNWFWLTGEPVDGIWGEGESDNITGPNENCLMLDTRNTVYKDQKCTFSWGYLCEPGPCYNKTCGTNAHCVVLDYVTSKCTCDVGYEGDADTECSRIDPCDPNPCGDHAECTAVDWNNYNCACEEGYVGDPSTACEYDPCHNVTCGAHAACVPLSNITAECQCIEGFTGNPQHGCSPIDYCEGIICSEHASCHATGPMDSKCTCDKGYHNIADPPALQCSGGPRSIVSSSNWLMVMLTLSATKQILRRWHTACVFVLQP